MTWYGCIEAITPSSRDALDVLGAQVLGVLDAEATVRGSVRRTHAVVDVEQHRVGALADGVHHDLQPGRIGRADPAAIESRGVVSETGGGGVVGVGLEEERRGRAQRAVHESL